MPTKPNIIIAQVEGAGTAAMFLMPDKRTCRTSSRLPFAWTVTDLMRSPPEATMLKKPLLAMEQSSQVKDVPN